MKLFEVPNFKNLEEMKDIKEIKGFKGCLEVLGRSVGKKLLNCYFGLFLSCLSHHIVTRAS